MGKVNVVCSECGASFKSAQGLAGHRQLKHSARNPSAEKLALSEAGGTTPPSTEQGGSALETYKLSELTQRSAERSAEPAQRSAEKRDWLEVAESWATKGLLASGGAWFLFSLLNALQGKRNGLGITSNEDGGSIAKALLKNFLR